MTTQEKMQATELNALLLARKLPEVTEREGQFIRSTAYKVTMEPHYWLSPKQGSWLNALAWRFRDELSAAGKWQAIVKLGQAKLGTNKGETK